MENNNQEFKYTYSSKEQAELKRIRDKYVPTQSEEENKLDRLRRLDGSVAKKAQTAALIVGILGALILGFGMSLVMTELSDMLGAYKEYSMPLGIVIGAVGIILVILAYPIYNLVTMVERKRIAPEIIRLTDELMK